MLSIGLAASAPRAQFDLTVNEVVPQQAIPGVTLIAGKSIIVRSIIGISGTIPSGTEVDAIMRVYVGGVEAPFSPVYTENAPRELPTAFNPGQINHSLNFVFIPPESNDVVLEVEVNPVGPNQVAETNFSNNTRSTPSLNFVCKDVPDLVYVPIDYRPSGGGANLPPQNLIQPGAGDNFIQAIYPCSDWEYRVNPTGEKLWTGNLSGSGSALLTSLRSDRLLMVPRPVKVYGWVPGSLPYNGVATLNGTAAMGNTQAIRHQRTFAHELGHLFGRNHISNTIQTNGIDVEHHLNITQSLPRLQGPNQRDIMVAGLLTNQAWVYATNYEVYVNRNEFACPNNDPLPSGGDVESLMIGGTWNRETNEFELSHLVTINATDDQPQFVPVSEADLVIRAFGVNGEVLGSFGLAASTTTDCAVDCDDEGECEHKAGTADSPFAHDPIESVFAVLPSHIDPNAIQRLVVSTTDADLAVVNRSNASPKVDIVSPVGSVSDIVNIEVAISDVDTPQTKQFVIYSPDGEQMMPIATATTETSFSVDMTRVPAFVEGKGFFEIRVTDGLNTTSVRTGALTTEDGAGNNPPSTFILTPDPGKSFRFGASVVLHCSGYDPEDTFLNGNSLVWTSNLDGQIGTGRVTMVQDLSVGTHVITVTATDSGGLTATDTETVIVTARSLPAATCQPDLGFGGPGSAVLQVCGGDLSSGTTAEMAMTGAAPNAGLAALFGTANSPFPIFGGNIVPNPIIISAGGVTDGSGAWSLGSPITGGLGPATFYTQVVYVDASQPFGFGLSNAVQVNVLP